MIYKYKIYHDRWRVDPPPCLHWSFVFDFLSSVFVEYLHINLHTCERWPRKTNRYNSDRKCLACMDAVSCVSYILTKNVGKSAKQALQCRLKAEWEGLEDCGRHVDQWRSWNALGSPMWDFWRLWSLPGKLSESSWEVLGSVLEGSLGFVSSG